MGFFKPKGPSFRIVKQVNGKRILDLSSYIEDKKAAFDYAREYAHVAPNRMAFMDRVHIWEEIYIPARKSEGWELLKGGRNSDERFKVFWKVGEFLISATQDDWEGLITEKNKPTKI